MGDTLAGSNRFLFYESFWKQFQMLDMQQRGEYITAMCRLAFDGCDTDFDNPMMAFGWQVMRAQVSESVRLHGQAIERGKKSGEVRRKRSAKSNGRRATGKRESLSESVSESLSESLSESVSETVSEIVSERKDRNGMDMSQEKARKSMRAKPSWLAVFPDEKTDGADAADGTAPCGGGPSASAAVTDGE